jgi:predicted Zn-dependent peptidase
MPSRLSRLVRRGLALRLLVLSIIVAIAFLGHGHHFSSAAGAADGAGLRVTLSATTENDATGSPSDLLVRITLDNQTGSALNDLSVLAPAIDGAVVTDSWVGQQGSRPGTLTSGALAWTGLAIANAVQLGPLAYRLAPASGQDGATIFTTARIRPSLTWSVAPEGDADVPELPLSGLWGETDLRRTVLPSGLTIFTQQRPDTPTVALRVAARAGSRDEDDSTCGGSHWLEHAHFLGTTTRPDNQAVGGAILSIGGQFNASTGWEATNFWNLVPADKFSTAVDVLSDQLINSTFAPVAFEREKQVIVQEIKLRADDPATHAFDDFMDLAFQVSPLHRSPAATVCLLTLPVSAILSYHAAHYVTGNMTIAASGNLRHDDAVASIATAFAGLPAGPRTIRAAVPEPIETQPRFLETGDASLTSTIRLGWPVAGEQSPDWPALVILSDLLGGVGERLAGSIRAHHVVGTGVDASYLDFSDAGALMLQASAPADQTGAAVNLLLAEVQRLRDGDVSAADVDEVMRATAGERAVDSELNLEQTTRATDEASGVLQSYDTILARLAAVTPADVQRVAQTYLDPVNYSLVILHQ